MIIKKSYKVNPKRKRIINTIKNINILYKFYLKIKLKTILKINSKHKKYKFLILKVQFFFLLE